MNLFLRKMGVPVEWEINDVYGLEEELLMMLPQPVLALLLLFPINDKVPWIANQGSRIRNCFLRIIWFLRKFLIRKF
jgi:hypothetical protein